jgi:hypothetical protein
MEISDDEFKAQVAKVLLGAEGKVSAVGLSRTPAEISDLLQENDRLRVPEALKALVAEGTVRPLAGHPDRYIHASKSGTAGKATSEPPDAPEGAVWRVEFDPIIRGGNVVGVWVFSPGIEDAKAEGVRRFPATHDPAKYKLDAPRPIPV